MKRWLRGRLGPRAASYGRSDEPGEAVNEEDASDDTVDVVCEADPAETEGGKRSRGNGDDSIAGGAPEDDEKLLVQDEGLGDLRWEVRRGSGSLVLSGLALVVLVGADLVDPEGTNPGRVFGGVGLYLAGVLVAFALERREHRKQRALLPVDRSGGGRLGLVLAAIVLGTVGDEEFRGLAAWVAFSAVMLGSWADGAWLAITAKRRGVGPLRAWMVLVSGERQARRQVWAALFGRAER